MSAKTEAMEQYGTNVASVLWHVRLRNPRSHSVSMVNSEEMNVGQRPAPPPGGLQAWGLHSSPRNSPLTHYYSEDFWLWRAKGLRQHCFHIVPWLPFLLTTFDCFSLSYILIIITIPRISFFLTCPISAGYVRIKGADIFWHVPNQQDTSEWNGRYWHSSMNTCQVCYSTGQPDFPQIIISMWLLKNLISVNCYELMTMNYYLPECKCRYPKSGERRVYFWKKRDNLFRVWKVWRKLR